jgi:hypothetical protein
LTEPHLDNLWRHNRIPRLGEKWGLITVRGLQLLISFAAVGGIVLFVIGTEGNHPEGRRLRLVILGRYFSCND